MYDLFYSYELMKMFDSFSLIPTLIGMIRGLEKHCTLNNADIPIIHTHYVDMNRDRWREQALKDH